MEEKIEKELNKNNPVCDLSEIELNEKMAKVILKKMKKKSKRSIY